MPKAKSLQEKLWDRVERNPFTGCLEWTGPVNSSGYGGVSLPPRRVVSAPTAAWIDRHGPIPKGLWVLHTCDNRRCCEVDHLFLGTRSDNMQDCVAKGRAARRSFWDTASDAEKAVKCAQIQAFGRQPKSAETRQRMAEARKRWWARKLTPGDIPGRKAR